MKFPWKISFGLLSLLGWLTARAKFRSAEPAPIVEDRGPNPPAVVLGAGTRSLTAFEKWALSGFIPQIDLNRAIMHVGELPAWADWVIRPNAMTVGNDIYFRNVQHFVSPKGLSLLAHELVHVGQYRAGMSVPSYLWASRNGYSHGTEFEAPAYELEKKVLAAMHLKLRGIDFGV